ncbi:hydroxyisourate hydrolase [Actinocorallia sp. A-T 12471]|uniref:hydroxyisourate hydrolase n=1 Tax=Actinocorallia sp. A-T 12471 TaxID=3089813 RepID=UPI0029CB1510|nr:hydroxyisourate hydrolase [Actinocorallia sp. A-T 12471]MDX6743544.1 hydroxyisourate hydrolase [Actinocorallia sp. A-T 12471]
MSLSTHVLDTTSGRPAQGVPVTLDSLGPQGWETVATGTTDDDGRISGWHVGPGRHRLTFDVPRSFFPEVSIVFDADGRGHLHIPLLLSNFGYTTYRGS